MITLSQISSHADSKTVTRRINDVVTMQAHMLLVSSVYEDDVSPAFESRILVMELRKAVREKSAEDVKRVMLIDPFLKKTRDKLEEDIRRYREIANIIEGNDTAGAAR